MRRLLRWAFNLAAAASAALFVAVCALWVRAWATGVDGFGLPPAKPTVIRSYGTDEPPGDTGPADSLIETGDLVTVILFDVEGPGTRTATTQRVRNNGTISLPFLRPLSAAGLTADGLEGVIVHAFGESNAMQGVPMDIRSVGRARHVPFGPFVAAFLVMPAAWAVAAGRRHTHGRRAALGLCPCCGYDLRATPENCPECGAAPTTKGVTA